MRTFSEGLPTVWAESEVGGLFLGGSHCGIWEVLKSAVSLEVPCLLQGILKLTIASKCIVKYCEVTKNSQKALSQLGMEQGKTNLYICVSLNPCSDNRGVTVAKGQMWGLLANLAGLG